MVNEVKNTPQGHVAVAAGPAASVPSQPAPAAAPAPLVVPKADIKFDAEKMRQNLEAAITQLNDMMRESGRGLSFSYDQKLGTPVVVVKNSATGEVVRQLPNEVVIRVAHSIEDFKGLLHNALI